MTSSRNALSSAGLPPRPVTETRRAVRRGERSLAGARGAPGLQPRDTALEERDLHAQLDDRLDSSPVSALIAVCSTRAGPSRSDGAEEPRGTGDESATARRADRIRSRSGRLFAWDECARFSADRESRTPQSRGEAREVRRCHAAAAADEARAALATRLRDQEIAARPLLDHVFVSAS